MKLWNVSVLIDGHNEDLLVRAGDPGAAFVEATLTVEELFPDALDIQPLVAVLRLPHKRKFATLIS